MLLRGCHRRMICLKSVDSHLFDEAFFVLREERTGAGEREILEEANRIVEEHLMPRRTRRQGRGHVARWLCPLLFVLGLSLGVGLGILLPW